LIHSLQQLTANEHLISGNFYALCMQACGSK
jgi:hypothetical protein